MRSRHCAVASSYEMLVNTLIKNDPRDQSWHSTEVPAHLCSFHTPGKAKQGLIPSAHQVELVYIHNGVTPSHLQALCTPASPRVPHPLAVAEFRALRSLRLLSDAFCLAETTVFHPSSPRIQYVCLIPSSHLSAEPWPVPAATLHIGSLSPCSRRQPLGMWVQD